MADTSSVSIQQLWQTPYIKGVYSELATPDMSLSKYYRVMDNRELAPARVFGWDQFNLTRTVSQMKVPQTAPTTIHRQKIASKTGALLRVAEKLHIYDEEIMNLRPPGAPIGTLNQRGEEWFTRQVDYLTQRHRNLMEIVVSKAIQGGFGMAKVGDAYILTELNASGNAYDIDMFQVDNDSTCRARHTGDLNGIIDTPWSDPGADIVKQLMLLRIAQIREYGRASDIAWTDSLTINYMMQNVSLSQIAGSANRVWEAWDANKGAVDVKPGDRNLGGMAIRFHAIPQYTFLVNDSVVSLGSSTDPQGSDSFLATGVNRVVPAGHVLFTPPPGDWFACYEGQEPVRTNWQAEAVTIANGFFAWNFPLPQHPPGREANIIDNFLPVIRMPRAIWNATVRTPDPSIETVA